MPRIPFGIQDSSLPASSGMRGGVVGTPVVQEPGLDADAATLPGRSLQGMGQQVAQTGQYLAQAEAYEFQRDQAQSVLDSMVSAQAWAQRYQPAIAERQRGDYHDMAKDIVKLGKTLGEQVALEHKLSPSARALFQEKTEAAITKAQHDTLGVETARMQQASIFTISTKVRQVQEAALQTRDDTELGMIMGEFQETLRQGVVGGLWTGQVASKMFTDTQTGIDLGKAHMAVRTAPAQALEDIVTRMQGGDAQVPALQKVSPAELPRLFDEAQQQLSHRVTLREAQGQRQQRALQDQQKMVASGYRARLYDPAVTIPTLLQMLEPINQDRSLQNLGEEDHTQLLSHIQTRIDKLSDDAYKDRDVSTIAKEGRLKIETAQTPADLVLAQQWVDANQNNLSSGTLGSMLGRITQRQDQNDPLNDDVAKEARRIFLSGAFPGGIVPAMLDKIDSGVQAKTSVGLDVLNTELRRLYETEGKDAMRLKGMDVGRRMKDLYFPESRQQQGPLPASLPPAFEGVTNFDDGLVVLGGLQLDPTAKRKIYLQLKESLPAKPIQPGTPPDLSKVPGYRPPGRPMTTRERSDIPGISIGR